MQCDRSARVSICWWPVTLNHLIRSNGVRMREQRQPATLYFKCSKIYLRDMNGVDAAAAAATIRRRLLSNVHRLWNAAMETLMDLAVLLWLPFPLSKVHGSRAISSYCNVCFIAQFLVCRQIVSKQTPSQLARMASHAIRHKFHPGTTTNHYHIRTQCL